jgi:hypothetical protein
MLAITFAPFFIFILRTVAFTDGYEIICCWQTNPDLQNDAQMIHGSGLQFFLSATRERCNN